MLDSLRCCVGASNITIPSNVRLMVSFPEGLQAVKTSAGQNIPAQPLFAGRAYTGNCLNSTSVCMAWREQRAEIRMPL